MTHVSSLTRPTRYYTADVIVTVLTIPANLSILIVIFTLSNFFKYLKMFFQILLVLQSIQKCGKLIFFWTFYFIASILSTITRYYDRNCRNFYYTWSIYTLYGIPWGQAILRFLTTLYKNLTKSLYVYRFFVFFPFFAVFFFFMVFLFFPFFFFVPPTGLPLCL